MKRRVYTMKFLAILFILMLMAQVTQAQPCDNAAATFSLDFSQATFYVTETFTVDVILNDGECVQGVALSIDYDDTKLTFNGASTVDPVDGGIFPNPQVLTPAAPPGVISRDITNLGAPVGSSATPITGAVLQLEFTVIDDGFNDIDFVVGSSGLHPRIAENDGGVFTFYDNVAATDATIENLPEILCDNSGAVFSVDLDRNVIGPDDAFGARLAIDDAQCVENISLTVNYDPALLSITGFSGIDQGDGGLFDTPNVTDDGSVAGELNVTITGINTPYGGDLVFVDGFLLDIEFETLSDGTAVVDYAVGPTGFNPRIGQRKGNVFSYVDNIASTDDSILIVPYLDVFRISDNFDDGDYTSNPTWFPSVDGVDSFELIDQGGGNFTACSEPGLQSGTLMTQSLIFRHWKFSSSYSPANPAFEQGIILMSDKLVEDIEQPFTGYYLSIINDEATILFKDGSAGVGTALGTSVAITSGAGIQVIRDGNGDFQLFETDNNDFSLFDWSIVNHLETFDDSEGLFDSKFTGFYYVDSTIGDACFDNVEYGIPAIVLNGNPGETNVHLLSSPIENSTYSDFFANVWTQGFTGSDQPAATSNVYVYDDTITPRNPVLNGSYLPPNNTTNRVGTRSDAESSAGRGVLAYIFSEPGYEGTYANGWPKVIEVDGAENSGDIDVPFSVTFSGDGGTYDSYDDGWHISGNPYPHTLSAQDLLVNSVGIHQAVYVWDQTMNGGQGDYRFYVRDTGGTVFDGHISPLQGFWVKANYVVDAELRFREDQLVLDQNAQLYETTIPAITLKAISGDVESTMMVAFNPDAEMGTDQFDAFMLNNGNQNSLNLYSANIENHPMTVNSYPAQLDSELRIPVYLKSNFASDAVLEWSGLENISSDWSVELLEVETNKRYNLRTQGNTLELPTQLMQNESDNAIGTPVGLASGNAPYVLIINGGEDDQNTELPEWVTLNQNYPNPFNPTTLIRYELPESADVRLEVYNLMGQRVATLVNESQTAGAYDVSFDAQNLASGVYIYRLQTGDVVLSRKMSLIK